MLLEEASTHKSAKIHTGKTQSDLRLKTETDLWRWRLTINGFPGLIVEHFYVKFGDLAASFFDVSGKTDSDEKGRRRE